MAQASITKRAVDAAKPADRDYFLWDDSVAGFGLKVTPAGGKVYLFQYRIARPGHAERTAPKRYTIGKHGSLTPDQARKRAKELAALVEQGIDPRQRELSDLAAKDEAARLANEKARIESELAFERVAALWLDHYENEKGRRPSSVGMAKLVVNRHLMPKLRGKSMPHIARADLQRVIDGLPISQRGIRRAVFAYASVLFGWAAKRGDIAANPLKEMAKPEPPQARDRVLKDVELIAVWNATAKLPCPFGAFYRLLILTGQRRSEVAGLNWGELDRATATWTIPAERAKNGVAHIVPLSDAVIAELDLLAKAAHNDDSASPAEHWPKAGLVLTTTGRTPISGMTRAKRLLDEAVAESRGGEGLPDWRVHDLRRTMATGFQRLGIRFEVTEATLNHVSGAKGGIAGVYQRHDWKEEKRSALEAWARHIGALLSDHADNEKIVPIASGKRL